MLCEPWKDTCKYAIFFIEIIYEFKIQGQQKSRQKCCTARALISCTVIKEYKRRTGN